MKKIFKIMIILFVPLLIVGCKNNVSSYEIEKKITDNKKDKEITDNIQDDNTAQEDSENQINKEKKTSQLVVTLTGDTNLASFYGKKIYFDDVYRKNGAGYFLKDLEQYFKNADLNITNIENVFTSSKIPQRGKIYTYKAYSSDYIDILTHNKILYANVVNNHMQDYKQVGFDESMKILESKGIKCFGTNLRDSNDPELGNIKVHKIQSFKKDDINVGMLGYYAFNSTFPADDVIKKDIDNLKKQGCNFIITSMHGGGQENNIVLKRQEIVAKKLIDLGSDLVYGHHPHALQRVEEYKGKKIYYSLGNFMFVNYINSKNPEALLIKLTLNMDNQGKITAKYEDIPILWMGNRSKNVYTPIQAKDSYTIDRVKNMLNGVIYVR